MIICDNGRLVARAPHDERQNEAVRQHKARILAALDPALRYEVTIAPVGRAVWMFALADGVRVARCLEPEGGAA